jgi:hypothetical protein
MVAFLGIPVAVLLGAICLAKKYPVESRTGIGGWLVVPGSPRVGHRRKPHGGRLARDAGRGDRR